jgi:hypothetical protein
MQPFGEVPPSQHRHDRPSRRSEYSCTGRAETSLREGAQWADDPAVHASRRLLHPVS